MDQNPTLPEPGAAPEPVRDLLAEQRELARDQIAAAWQLHIERIQEQLEAGWRDQVGRALEERFAAMGAALEAEVGRRVAESLAEESQHASAAAARALTERLNQSARRFEQAEDSQAWASALLDAACAFAPRVVLFSALTGELKYEGHRALGGEDLAGLADFHLPIAEVPAVAGVAETRDTVIAMATPGELSQPLADALALGENQRVCLVPVFVGRGPDPEETRLRLAAVLCADGAEEPLDVNALELLAAHAGATLDARFHRPAAPAPAGPLIGIVAPPPPAPEPAPAAAVDYASLPKEEQELHSRAQRFARVRVAEMRLYQPEAVRQGREQARLYQALRGEMDRSRTQFQHEFLCVPSMVDYFHIEVLRTLANDDPSLLGPDYPGPLV
jgi:hypothetical protein